MCEHCSFNSPHNDQERKERCYSPILAKRGNVAKEGKEEDRETRAKRVPVSGRSKIQEPTNQSNQDQQKNDCKERILGVPGLNCFRKARKESVVKSIFVTHGGT